MQHFWEERYATDEYAYGTEPNAYMVSRLGHLHGSGSVLAVADGEGRNGVWLAKQGYDVTSVDGAMSGLTKAKKLARSQGVLLKTIHADLYKWNWPVAAYDHLVSIFVQFPDETRAQQHHHYAAALKPGGIILLQAFSREQLNFNSGGPRNLKMLYTAEALADDFADLEIIELEEMTVELDEGRFHQGRAAVVNFLARKPVDAE